jgi:protein-disulfide isomerase
LARYDAGKLMEFHGHLLRNQPAEDTLGPTDEQFAGTGDSMGLGTGFKNCVSGRQKLDWVDRATDAAKTYGVSSVPAVYVNDTKVTATRAALDTAIAAAP